MAELDLDSNIDLNIYHELHPHIDIDLDFEFDIYPLLDMFLDLGIDLEVDLDLSSSVRVTTYSSLGGFGLKPSIHWEIY